MKKLILLLGIFVSQHCLAAEIVSTTPPEVKGTISELYVNDGGGIALQLTGGITASFLNSVCATNNGYIGHSHPDPVLKSALLAAFAANQTVKICLSKCDDNLAWVKSSCVYVTH